MSDDVDAVRGFWFEGGPLVVFSQLTNSTVTGIEESVIAVVNEVMERAEGGDSALTDDLAGTAPPGSAATSLGASAQTVPVAR